VSKKDSKGQEPWEQPIYDTEYESATSRSEKRGKKQSKGTGFFMPALIVLILAIIIVPMTYFYIRTNSNALNNPKDEPKTVVKNSSTEESTTESTKTSSTESSTAETAVEESKPAEQPAEQPEEQQEEQPAENQNNQQPENNQQAAGSTHTVQQGDNLYRIANANGLSVDQLKSMNGLSSNELSVGQVLKVK